MSHYKPYPAYKDSGVEWFSRLPMHWEYSKIGLVAEVLAGYAFQADKFDSDGIAVVRMSDLKAGEVSFDSIKKYPEADVPAKAHAKSGDLLVGLSGSISNFAIVKQSDLPLAVNQRVGVIRSNSCDGSYLTYFLRSYSYIQQILSQLPETTILNIAMEQLRSARIPWPEKNVRDAVVRHLDQETARIDALISKKTRFIELLREKRQALITHAVTKGLDPGVKMKDSGVEWLGEVPEHWDALPLRRVVTAVKTGGTPSSESPSPGAEGLAWYTPGDFGNSLVLGASEKRVSSQVVISGEAKVYPAGSVMVVSIGATLGKVGFLAEAASANQQINAVIPNGCVDGYFLAYSLSVKTEVMWFLANAATIGIMNQEKTKEIWVAIPSVAEQMGISAHLDRETSRIDRLVEKTEYSIELLKERRSALITAAVTGQINFQ